MNRRCSTHQLSSMPFIDYGFQQQTDSEPYPNRSPYRSFILFLCLCFFKRCTRRGFKGILVLLSPGATTACWLGWMGK